MKLLATSILPLLIGMNFSFLDPNMHDPSACSQDHSVNLRGTAILPRYQDPAVRAKVQAELISMHNDGFNMIRTLVMFSVRPSQNSDWFDINTEMTSAPKLIADYLDDVAKAGFEHVELAFSPQAEASPSCKKKQWGDCFDATSIRKSVDFIVSVRQTTKAVSIRDVRIDLSNESCVTSTIGEPLTGNLRSYVRSLIKGYINAVPGDQLTISCVIGRIAEGRQDIDSAFASAGARPSFYELHGYQHSDSRLSKVDSEVRAGFEGTNLPVIVGETSYGTPSYTKKLLASLAETGVNVDAVIFWPLQSIEGGCGVDVPPPYTRKGAIGE